MRMFYGPTTLLTDSLLRYIVEDVLNVMQLVDVQHSLVGNVERRGISGGQRKRVNIGIPVAHEALAWNPPMFQHVIFFLETWDKGPLKSGETG